MADLLILDSEYKNAQSDIREYCRILGEAFNEYLDCLRQARDNGVMSGKTKDALNTFIEYVSEYAGLAENVGTAFAQMVDAFIDAIDVADDYLYEKGGSFVRDFSEEERKKLITFLSDPWCEVTDNIGDWFLSKWMKWFGVSVTNPKSDIDAAHKALLDINDASKTTINAIFSNVEAIDKQYGRSLQGSVADGNYYTGAFGTISSALSDFRDALNKMAEIIDPQNGCFTSANIKNSLGPILESLKKSYNEAVKVVDSVKGASIEEIGRFAEWWLASSVFINYTTALNEFIAGLGTWDAVQMLIFKGFDIAEGQITNGFDYNKRLIKDELFSILSDMAETEQYKNSNEKEAVSNIKEYWGYIKKYGQDWYDYWIKQYDKTGKKILDGRTKEARRFKEFLGSLGDAIDILSYGDNAVELVYKVFNDYSANAEIIERFTRNCSGCDDMSRAAAELESLYKNEMLGIIAEARDQLADVTFEALMAALSEALPPMKVVKKIGKAIDTVGEITGLGAEAQSTYNALIYHDMYVSAEQAYRSALEKVQDAIKEGNNSGEEYEQLCTDLGTCYQITKDLLVKTFKEMAAAETGDKKDYFYYCQTSAQSMRMFNVYTKQPEEFEIMSYDEYMASRKD